MEFRELLHQLFQEVDNRYHEMVSEEANRQNLVEDDIITQVDREMTRLFTGFFRDLEPEFDIQSEENLKREKRQKTENLDYTVIIDDLDATQNFRDQYGSFGPIVGIAEGGDPEFRDVVAAGYLDLNHGVFYDAYRGEGAYRTLDFPDGERERLETNGRKKLENGEMLSLLLDQAMLGKAPKIAENAWKYWCKDFGSMGKHFALVAEGSRDGFISGGHGYVKKKNTGEEIAGMHLVVEEAGGSVTGWNGKSIARKRIGMRQGKNHDIIAAATHELAEKISENVIPEEYH